VKAGEKGPKKPRKAARAAAPRRSPKAARTAFEEDFGPGPEAVPPPAPSLLPGYACGGETCALHPLRTIAERVLGDALKGGPSGAAATMSAASSGAAAAVSAASSGAAAILATLAAHSVDVLRMVRDLVNQEIARKETPAEGRRRYTKIPVD
jgi:hypothetical protein